MSDEPRSPGALLIDTDVFSWLVWKRDRYIEYAALIEGYVIALSFATVGELLRGAYQANYGSEKIQLLQERIGRAVILRSTDDVIDWYGRIHARFHTRLQAGGVNDMWTAACALAQPSSIPIVTGNISDFGSIATEFPIELRLLD